MIVSCTMIFSSALAEKLALIKNASKKLCDKIKEVYRLLKEILVQRQHQQQPKAQSEQYSNNKHTRATKAITTKRIVMKIKTIAVKCYFILFFCQWLHAVVIVAVAIFCCKLHAGQQSNVELANSFTTKPGTYVCMYVCMPFVFICASYAYYNNCNSLSCNPLDITVTTF